MDAKGYIILASVLLIETSLASSFTLCLTNVSCRSTSLSRVIMYFAVAIHVVVLAVVLIAAYKRGLINPEELESEYEYESELINSEDSEHELDDVAAQP